MWSLASLKNGWSREKEGCLELAPDGVVASKQNGDSDNSQFLGSSSGYGRPS